MRKIYEVTGIEYYTDIKKTLYISEKKENVINFINKFGRATGFYKMQWEEKIIDPEIDFKKKYFKINLYDQDQSQIIDEEIPELAEGGAETILKVLTDVITRRNVVNSFWSAQVWASDAQEALAKARKMKEKEILKILENNVVKKQINTNKIESMRAK